MKKIIILTFILFSLTGCSRQCRLAEMHRRICHAWHDVHFATRMPRAFLNDVYIDIFFVDFYSRKQENEDVAADFGNCRICPVFCI